MIRGRKAQPEADDTAAKQAELAGLQARINQLKAAERDRDRCGAVSGPRL